MMKLGDKLLTYFILIFSLDTHTLCIWIYVFKQVYVGSEILGLRTDGYIKSDTFPLP